MTEPRRRRVLVPESTVSVLIATRNRPLLFARSAAAVLQMDPPPNELWVMDQSDDDETRIELEKLDPGVVTVHYEHLERPGKSRALNQALEQATGEFVALTDDDVTVSESWIGTFLELHARMPDVDAFCGRVLPEDGTDPSDYLNLVESLEPRTLDRSTNPISPSFCGANLMIRRSALVGVGGYDLSFGPGAKFKSNDDGELAYRLTRAGLHVRYTPELWVTHLGWRQESDNRALLHDYAFSLGGFAGNYLRRGVVEPLPHFAKLWAEKTAQIALGIVRFDRRRIRDGVAHLVGFAQGAVTGLCTRPSSNAAE